MARLGKRERAQLKASKAASKVRKARVSRIVPVSSGMRSAWDNMLPHGKPRADWSYNSNTARSWHRPEKVRHIKP